MFLAGGLGKGSPHCIITLVGSNPTMRPLKLDENQAQAMLQTRLERLEADEVSRTLPKVLGDYCCFVTMQGGHRQLCTVLKPV